MPKRKPTEPHTLTVRLSEEDLIVLRERATEQGMSQSEYLRFLIRKARLVVSVET